ncbi:hypothetical protein Nepgr_011497 [Nepenthes gracilis]|uniref:Uncharacterized protein n=1 Tax=Nepenthes gracilis TaxID=150966 RepID=A0AAD3SFK5_NEPGR|nr:hypothetical protein Nepgr_011497 [Nepenthes gracilis]
MYIEAINNIESRCNPIGSISEALPKESNLDACESAKDDVRPKAPALLCDVVVTQEGASGTVAGVSSSFPMRKSAAGLAQDSCSGVAKKKRQGPKRLSPLP